MKEQPNIKLWCWFFTSMWKQRYMCFGRTLYEVWNNHNETQRCAVGKKFPVTCKKRQEAVSHNDLAPVTCPCNTRECMVEGDPETYCTLDNPGESYEKG